MPKTSIAKIKKAQILNDQAKPTFGTSWFSIMGKITPPRLDPAATMPMAKARLFMNHVDTQLVAGINKLGFLRTMVRSLTRTEKTADSNRTANPL